MEDPSGDNSADAMPETLDVLFLNEMTMHLSMLSSGVTEARLQAVFDSMVRISRSTLALTSPRLLATFTALLKKGTEESIVLCLLKGIGSLFHQLDECPAGVVPVTLKLLAQIVFEKKAPQHGLSMAHVPEEVRREALGVMHTITTRHRLSLTPLLSHPGLVGYVLYCLVDASENSTTNGLDTRAMALKSIRGIIYSAMCDNEVDILRLAFAVPRILSSMSHLVTEKDPTRVHSMIATLSLEVTSTYLSQLAAAYLDVSNAKHADTDHAHDGTSPSVNALLQQLREVVDPETPRANQRAPSPGLSTPEVTPRLKRAEGKGSKQASRKAELVAKLSLQLSEEWWQEASPNIAKHVHAILHATRRHSKATVRFCCVLCAYALAYSMADLVPAIVKPVIDVFSVFVADSDPVVSSLAVNAFYQLVAPLRLRRTRLLAADGDARGLSTTTATTQAQSPQGNGDADIDQPSHAEERDCALLEMYSTSKRRLMSVAQALSRGLVATARSALASLGQACKLQTDDALLQSVSEAAGAMVLLQEDVGRVLSTPAFIATVVSGLRTLLEVDLSVSQFTTPATTITRPAAEARIGGTPVEDTDGEGAAQETLPEHTESHAIRKVFKYFRSKGVLEHAHLICATIGAQPEVQSVIDEIELQIAVESDQLPFLLQLLTLIVQPVQSAPIIAAAPIDEPVFKTPLADDFFPAMSEAQAHLRARAKTLAEEEALKPLISSAEHSCNESPPCLHERGDKLLQHGFSIVNTERIIAADALYTLCMRYVWDDEFSSSRGDIAGGRDLSDHVHPAHARPFPQQGRNMIEIHREILTVVLVLEGIATVAEVQGERFLSKVVEATYLLLHFSLSSNLIVRTSAEESLWRLSEAMGFTAIGSFIGANVDALLGLIASNFWHLRLHPEVPRVLCALLRYAPATSFFSVKVVLDRTFKILDGDSGRSGAFLMLLHQYLLAIKRWQPALQRDYEETIDEYERLKQQNAGVEMKDGASDDGASEGNDDDDDDNTNALEMRGLELIEKLTKEANPVAAEALKQELAQLQEKLQNMMNRRGDAASQSTDTGKNAPSTDTDTGKNAPSADTDRDGDSDEMGPAPYLSATAEITDRINKHLNTRDPHDRKRCIMALHVAYSVLKINEKLLLPLLHQGWDSLVYHMDAKNEPSLFVRLAIFDFLPVLTHSSGDFVSKRFSKILPSVCTMLEELSLLATDESARKMTRYHSTSKTILATLAAFRTVWGPLFLSPRHVRAVACASALFAREPHLPDVQSCAVEALKALSDKNAAVVWFVLVRLWRDEQDSESKARLLKAYPESRRTLSRDLPPAQDAYKANISPILSHIQTRG